MPYETFATADGQIAVAVGSERQWPRLCQVLGLEHLATDERFADNGTRVRNRDVLRPMLALARQMRGEGRGGAADPE